MRCIQRFFFDDDNLLMVFFISCQISYINSNNKRITRSSYGKSFNCKKLTKKHQFSHASLAVWENFSHFQINFINQVDKSLFFSVPNRYRRQKQKCFWNFDQKNFGPVCETDYPCTLKHTASTIIYSLFKSIRKDIHYLQVR